MPQQVAFFSQGSRLVGSLWAPARTPAPTVLVMESWTT